VTRGAAEEGRSIPHALTYHSAFFAESKALQGHLLGGVTSLMRQVHVILAFDGASIAFSLLDHRIAAIYLIATAIYALSKSGDGRSVSATTRYSPAEIKHSVLSEPTYRSV
jgi:hypothetical protein